jgi:phenylacetate-CoA ligase
MYEHVFRRLLFPFYERVIKRRGTDSHLAHYERSQWLDPAQLEALQLAKLNSLLATCWEHVPFYVRHWRAAGLSPRPLTSVADLAHYPTIDKRAFSDHGGDMRARNFTGRTLTKTTGGSTGDPMRFEYSEESYARRTAVMWRGYRWAQAELGRRTAYLWGVGAPGPGLRGLKDRLYHAAFNRQFLDSFTMTDANLGEYVERLNRFRPEIVVGYVAPLRLLASWITAHGASVHRPRGILSGAEALHQADREIIERAFGAPVFNTYGCRELMLLASECGERHGLHVNADHLIFETVDRTGAPVVGVSGDVCLTDLHNYAMPFVRYLNGDAATSGTRRCPCGRGLPLLESVDGRVLDVIKTPDGRHILGEFFVYVMLGLDQVRQYQVVQDVIDELEMKIVGQRPLTADERRFITDKITAHTGSAMRVKITEVSSIPLTPSGKRRVTISNLTKP